MKKKVISIIVVLVLFVCSCIPAFAYTGTLRSMYVYPNQDWIYCGYETHDYNQSINAAVWLISVSPADGSFDLFYNLRSRLKNHDGIVVSNQEYVILNENYGGYQPIALKPGYYATDTLYFQFCGNTNSDAYASVYTLGTY